MMTFLIWQFFIHDQEDDESEGGDDPTHDVEWELNDNEPEGDEDPSLVVEF